MLASVVVVQDDILHQWRSEHQAHIKDERSLKNARELVQRAIQWKVAEKAT